MLVLLLLQTLLRNGAGADGGDAYASETPRRGNFEDLLLMQHRQRTSKVYDRGLKGVAELRESSRRLSDNLVRAAGLLPGDSTAKELLESFRICGQCETFERLGEAHDGGYLTCMDDATRGQQLLAAYSFGVLTHDKWAEDVASRLRVPVHQFDCTVSNGSACVGCFFYQKCIRSEDGHQDLFPNMSLSLGDVLQVTGQQGGPDRSLLMKMDVEGAEFPIWEVESPDVLRKFQQIIVEFHSIGHEPKQPQALRAIRRLLAAGFLVVHLHGNNCDGMYEVAPGMDIPTTIEVTLVAGAAARDDCLSQQEYLPADAVNLEDVGELPLAHLR